MTGNTGDRHWDTVVLKKKMLLRELHLGNPSTQRTRQSQVSGSDPPCRQTLLKYYVLIKYNTGIYLHWQKRVNVEMCAEYEEIKFELFSSNRFP